MIPTTAEKILPGITYTASGGALIFGLQANEFAAVVGAAVAVLGLLTQTAISIYFKQQRLNLERTLAAEGKPDCATCPDRGED